MKNLIPKYWRTRGLTARSAAFAAACAALFLSASPAGASTLLSYWDFNNVSTLYSGTTIGVFSTANAGFGEVYSSATKHLSANSASGLYTSSYLDFSGLIGTVNSGSTGASGWGAFKDASTNLAGGQTSNLASGDASTQQGGLLMLVNNSPGTSALTDSLVFSLDTAGYQGISLSYAGRYGSTPPTLTWSYSYDGTTWNSITSTTTGSMAAIASYYDLVSSFGSALDNQNSVYLKMSFTVPMNTTVSFAVDNIQVLASSPLIVPEPSTWLLLGAGGGLLVLAGRARRRPGVCPG